MQGSTTIGSDHQSDITDEYTLRPVVIIIIVWGIISLISRFISATLLAFLELPNIIPTIILQVIGLIVVYVAISRIPEITGEFEIRYQLLPEDKNYSLWALVNWFTVLGSILLIGIIISILFSGGGGQQTTAYDNLIETPSEVFLVMISVAILAPIFEELLFRRLGIELFIQNGSTTTSALFFSSFLFAISHMLGDLILGTIAFTISHFLSTFILGTLLGYIYLKTKNIVYPIVIHGINNGFSFLGLVITVLFPVTDSAQEKLQSGATSDLSDTAIRNLTINIGYIIFLLIFFGLSLIYALYKTIKHRNEWWTAFTNGLNHITDRILNSKMGWYTIGLGIISLVIIPYTSAILILSLFQDQYVIRQISIALGTLLVVMLMSGLYFKTRHKNNYKEPLENFEPENQSKINVKMTKREAANTNPQNDDLKANICPNCGHENPSNANFCIECGNAI